MECIILAGGLGTRLRSEIEDVPKCMAPINGKPFLEYLFEYLERQFVDTVILSLGYQHRVVSDWLNGKAFTFKIQRVVETDPLGTGGGIRLALRKAKEAQAFILNGDTLFDVDLRAMKAQMKPTDKAVVALKPMQNFDRYGSVLLDNNNYIKEFKEKEFCQNGLINGGVYLLNTGLENLHRFPDQFSFEKDFLEKESGCGSLHGFQSDNYFIDIGIPEDYHRAEKEFSRFSE